MDYVFESLELCVSICNVPDFFSKGDVICVVNAHILDVDGYIVSIEPVLDVDDEKKDLQKWILLLNSLNCVATLVSLVRKEEISIDNKIFTIEYRNSTSYEVPEHWRKLIPKLGCHVPSSPDEPSFHGQTSPDRPEPIAETCQDYHEPGISHTGLGNIPETSQHFPEHIQYPKVRFYPYQGVDPLRGDFHPMFMPQFPTNPGYSYPCTYPPDTHVHSPSNPAQTEMSSHAACDMASLTPTVQYPAQKDEAFHESDLTNDIDLSNQMMHLNIQDRNDDSLKAEEDSNHNKIMVSKIPEAWLDEEQIKMIFENRKYGGFEVASVTLDIEKAKAIVEFVAAEACENILQKYPVIVSGNELHLEIYIPEQEEQYESDDDKSDEIKNPTKILVSNLPSSAHDEYLTTFFESRKLGDWPVVNVEMIEDQAAAIVEFKHFEAVCDIMKRCPIQMMDKIVDVEIYQQQPVCTIEVRGPGNVVNRDQLPLLELYFENTKRSGGSDIVNSHFDEKHSVVYITYQSQEVAERVVAKSSHVLKKEKLTVQLHVPSMLVPFREKSVSLLAKKDTDMGNGGDGSLSPLYTVKVKGYPKSKNRSTFEFYFENKCHSGGGPIVAIESDNDEDDVIYVTFENEEVANEVANCSHIVEGYDLAVTLHIPSKPQPCYENRVLIKNIQPTTTKDGLFNFLEAKTGCIPKALMYNAKDESVAMVTFETLDFGKMKENLKKYKLEGASLQVLRVLISNCILVSNLASDITRDMVQYYFENTRKSGGGQVDKVVMQWDEGSCLVYFNDFHAIDEVLNRDHILNGQKIGVHRYLKCLGRLEEDT